MMTEDDDSRVDPVAVERPPSNDVEGRAMRGRIAGRLFGEQSGPVLIGRFEQLESIGAGGMGVVYRGRDPTLDREVALKLLHPKLVDDERDRARLLREAQALARLSHPNVVQLYEVGEHDDGLFLAMEYVPGVPLSRWQRDPERSWAERVEVYAQAGRGLAAAHEAGLVHRDFKPSNVLVGSDGRVRVADFGLAQGLGMVADSERSSGSTTGASGRGGSGGGSLTRTGAVVGTPAYMSPEQRRREPIDARSDQFSFCVALWESVFGERPGPDATADALGLQALVDTPAAAMPKAAARRLLQVLARGVRQQPDERWPSMAELLEALATLESRGRGWGPVSLVALGGLGVLGWAMSAMAEHPVCDRLERATPRWTEASVASLRDAASGLRIEGRERAAESVDQVMREHVGQWSEVADRVCTGARDDPRDDAPVELRAACLESLARDFGREVRVMLEEPDALLAAHESLAQLLPPRLCEQQPALALGDADDELDDATRLALTRGRVLTEAGRYDDALAVYDGLAAAQGDEPSLPGARVMMGRAAVFGHRGQLEPAHRQQRGAVEQAIALGNPGLQAAAWAGLAKLEAGREHYEAARSLARQCLAAAGAAPSPLARADCWQAMASAYPGPDAAFISVPLAELARAARREVYGPRPDGELEIQQRIANAYADVGERDQDPELLGKARSMYVEEGDRVRERFGTQHPAALVLDFDLALLDVAQGRYEDARDAVLRVVVGLEAVYGMTTKLGGPLVMLAKIEAVLGEVDQAWLHVERAIEVQADLPREHSEAGAALSFGAQLAGATGELPRALALYERLATRWGEQARGERNLVWHNVAYYRCLVHRCEGAAEALDRVDRQAVAASGVEVRLNVDNVYAMVAMAEGDLLYARNYAQRVLRGVQGAEMAGQAEVAAAFEAEARWTLARAAMAAGDEQEAGCEAARAMAKVEGDAVTQGALRALDARPFEWGAGARAGCGGGDGEGGTR
ncbi:MAG: protein kinase [Nannocystaceae bacterium]